MKSCKTEKDLEIAINKFKKEGFVVKYNYQTTNHILKMALIKHNAFYDNEHYEWRTKIFLIDNKNFTIEKYIY